MDWPVTGLQLIKELQAGIIKRSEKVMLLNTIDLKQDNFVWNFIKCRLNISKKCF